MKTRKIGKTDLNVSELCLGTMYFGWREPREQSVERLDQYTQAGGNFLDTANIYAAHLIHPEYYTTDFARFEDGASERLIGEWMKEKGIRRQLIIASKMGFPYPGVEKGTSARQIKAECEKSLQRLQTDYLDLYYLHTDDRNTPLEEELEALTQLVREGKVRCIGASNWRAWRLAQAAEVSRINGFAEFCCIQQRHSYLRPKVCADFGGQTASNEDLFDFVRNNGMTLLAYSALLGGYYSNRGKKLMAQYAGEDNRLRLAALDAVSQETGASPVQLVYYWMMHSNPSVLPLAAASSKEQLDEALGSLSLQLTPEQFERLDRAGL